MILRGGFLLLLILLSQTTAYSIHFYQSEKIPKQESHKQKPIAIWTRDEIDNTSMEPILLHRLPHMTHLFLPSISFEVRPEIHTFTNDILSKSKTNELQQYSYVLLTSPKASSLYNDILTTTFLRARSPRIACVGIATANCFSHPVDFIPTIATGRAMASELPVSHGDKVLFPKSLIGGTDIIEILSAKGVRVDAYDIYTSKLSVWDEEKYMETIRTIMKEGQSTVVFMSPLAVDSFVENWKSLTKEGTLMRFTAVCIGFRTGATAEKYDFFAISYLEKPSFEEILRFMEINT